MTQDTTKGLTYPEATDHTRLWEHIQNLATDVDTNLGAFVCTSGTRPGSPWQGQQIYETDTRLLRTWDGSAWMIISLIGAWYSYTPVVYDGDSVLSGGAISAVEATYTRVGQTIIARGTATFTSATSVGAGISLPIQAVTRYYSIGSAAVYGSGAPTDQSGQAYMNADLAGVSRLVIAAYSTGFRQAAAGNSLRFTATYQAIAGA